MPDEAKKILFKSQARQKIFQGIQLITDAVKTNFGKNYEYFDDDFIKDLISNYIKDDFEKIGAEFALKTAYKTRKCSSDGATRALIMLEAILKKGLKLIDRNICPQSVNKELDLALTKLMLKIEKMTYLIKDEEDIAKISNYYARNDKEVSRSVTKCLKKVGMSGIVMVEEAQNQTTKIKLASGLEINEGYLSNYFCNNESNTLVEFDSCNLLIIDKKISSIQEIFPILKHLTRTQKELLVIARDIQEDVVSTLAMNKLQKTIKIAAVKSPYNRPELMKDIASLTNSKIITQGDDLLNQFHSALGYVDKVIVYKDRTVIAVRKAHSPTCDHLKNKIAIISTGRNEQKKLYESCITKTTDAIKHGVIAGGNIGLLFALTSLNFSDLRIGGKLLKAAIYAPLIQIISNAGCDPLHILDRICRMGYPNGFNLTSHQVENFLKCGILDPVNVIKSSLSNAISTAKTILLTEAVMTNSTD